MNLSHSNEALEVKVKYEKIYAGQFPNEVIATFIGLKGKFTVILPSSFVDKSTQSINAFVVNQEGDKYLVDLPTHTITSGSKVWFGKKSILGDVK